MGRVKHLIFGIKCVVEDYRNNIPGGICSGFLIWETAVVPYLYHSSECWVEVPAESLVALNSLQETLLRVLLRAPKTTPKVALSWESGMLSAEDRIVKTKLMFFHHVVTLPKDSLTYLVYREQRKDRSLPSLTEGCLQYLAYSI